MGLVARGLLEWVAAEDAGRGGRGAGRREPDSSLEANYQDRSIDA